MKTISLLLFSILFTGFLFAQSNTENSISKAYSPTIGVGVGTIGFYGDLNDRKYGSPFTGNSAVNVFVIQPVYDFLNVKFNFLIAQVRQEERSLQRNLNFQTDIRSGSIMLEYNFDHFLPESRKITPFITSGIEIAEYNPKTDLEAFGGERYNYWTDGTIRNISENDPDANQSVIIQRDYSYETDIREAGFNNSTTYSERAIAIPVGLGVVMHLNDQFNFRLESIVHFTFSDYFDGITPSTKAEFVGSKKGNGRNDHFVYSGFSISYNFQKVEAADPFDRIDNDPVDFLASGNTEDFDNDGVIDLVDNCPNTFAGAMVDSLGCPVDTDGDGVPDYKDKQLNTEYPEFANQEGVELTNDMIYKSYLQYIDSTLELAEVVERDFTGKRKTPVKYRVKVGEYKTGESPKDMSKLLSLPDLNKLDQNGTTYYTAGNYKTADEASKRVNELSKQGFEDAEVLSRANSGKYVSSKITALTPSKISEIQLEKQELGKEEVKPESEETEVEKETVSDQVVFRVQLGAFKTKPGDPKFKNIPNLFVVQAGDYYRYMSGSFTDFNSAAKHKVKMVVEGYKGAFVVAYKNGKRVSLKSVGVNPISSDPLIGK